VVHGSDGLDELTVTGPSQVAEWNNASISQFELVPEMAGLRRWPADSLKGGSANENAAALRRLLDGQINAYRDITLLNAGAALLIAGRAASLAVGAEMAASAIDGGAARQCLQSLILLSNQEKPT
jgi:anthranilate phosphoribosyltransferase